MASSMLQLLYVYRIELLAKLYLGIAPNVPAVSEMALIRHLQSAESFCHDVVTAHHVGGYLVLVFTVVFVQTVVYLPSYNGGAAKEDGGEQPLCHSFYHNLTLSFS